MADLSVDTSERAVGVLWGAAFGDALGWPQEDRARRVPSGRSSQLLFAPWVKRSGGRFLPHEEQIEGGSYSDDTQLILAVARARLTGDDWAHYLASVELPFWPVYERGGGGATLRAARLLQRSILPWDASPAETAKYWSAGGNGVAMRIAPHVLVAASLNNFDEIAESVFADGVTTHGHPRALVGALVYAFALWRAFGSNGTLPYGHLLKEVATNISDWSRIPSIARIWPNWREAAPANFEEVWDQTIDEVRDALEVAGRGLANGALAVDEETLERLGCLDRRTNGAGTVCAVAAIFLASKHAASPFEGVARAALAPGADTDTLASMTGALMGAISGTAWLGGRCEKLQDSRYIADIANRLVRMHPGDRSAPVNIRSRDVEAFVTRLSKGVAQISLPWGGHAEVTPYGGVHSSTPSIEVEAWLLSSNEGQSFVVKSVRKANKARRVPQPQPANPEVVLTHKKLVPGRFAGVTIAVSDLGRSKSFYCDALALPISRESGQLVQLGDHLAIREAPPSRDSKNFTLYVRVDDIAECHLHIQRMSLAVSPMQAKSGRRSFVCKDFDGNLVEVLEDGHSPQARA